MKHLIVILVGLLSMFIALAGAVCAFHSIFTGDGPVIVMGLCLLPCWGYLVYDWITNFRNDKVVEWIMNKINKDGQIE